MGIGETNPPGLVISSNDSILSFINSAARDPKLSQELQQIASDLSSKPNVPYKFLRALWFASNVARRPNWIQLLAGSDFILSSPKPREKVNANFFTLEFYQFVGFDFEGLVSFLEKFPAFSRKPNCLQFNFPSFYVSFFNLDVKIIWVRVSERRVESETEQACRYGGEEGI